MTTVLEVGGDMFRKVLTTVGIASMLVFGIATDTRAQASDEAKKAGQEAEEAAKHAGEAGKSAGKATADAAKSAGEATKKAAKKTADVTTDAAKETATGTEKAAKKTKKAVTPDTTSALCNDGTVHTGKTKTTACIDHGGVKD
jgi:colicin import membrane protein